jgi:hypothetical protein
MPNIADVMLNKRLDTLRTHEDALSPDQDWYPPHRRALEAQRDHLRTLCLRGLARCYPALSPAQLEERLMVALWVNR